MADASGKLSRCLLRLQEQFFYMFHQEGIKLKASDVLLLLETNGGDSRDLDDEIPVLIIKLSKNSHVGRNRTFSMLQDG